MGGYEEGEKYLPEYCEGRTYEFGRQEGIESDRAVGDTYVCKGENAGYAGAFGTCKGF